MNAAKPHSMISFCELLCLASYHVCNDTVPHGIAHGLMDNGECPELTGHSSQRKLWQKNCDAQEGNHGTESD